MKILNKLAKPLMLFFFFYALLAGTYIIFSANLSNSTLFLNLRRYVPCALAMAISATCWYRTTGNYKGLAPHFLVSLGWIICYPAFYWLTFHKNTVNTLGIDNHYDISYGAYLYTALVLLNIIVSGSFKKEKVTKAIIALFLFFTALNPLFQIAYYITYQTPVTAPAALAALQTNSNEAKEYILDILGIPGLAIITIVLLALAYALYKSVQHVESSASKKMVLVMGIICCGSLLYLNKILPNTGVMQSYRDAKDYLASAAKFEELHKENFNRLTVKLPNKRLNKPHTIIMVIGESESSEFMSAYKETEFNTTPWLRTQATNPNFTIFKHAYTSWGQTVPSLERALTEKDQYNTKEFNDSISIIDIAKKAGYKTYWLSNQGFVSDADTPISLVAKTADYSKWLEEDSANSDSIKYDGDLLPLLDKINPNENNFIIMHIMGSHTTCFNRYPASENVFAKDAPEDPILTYFNSVHYTDKVLKEIYDYGNSKLNLQTMIYFSDHGGNPYHKRKPDETGFIALRVPFFIYLGNAYRATYLETAAAIKEHQGSYFTNDLMYEAMCGIMQVKSAHYDASDSIASPTYKHTRETLTTRLGKTKLTEDKSAE